MAARYWKVRYRDNGSEYITNVFLHCRTMDAVLDYCIQVKRFQPEDILSIRPFKPNTRIVLHGTHCEDDGAYHH